MAVSGLSGVKPVPPVTDSYRYNGDGLRMSKTVNGSTENFTYDVDNGTPLVLVDGSTSYVYGPRNLPLEEVTSAGTYYYHHDQLGSTRLLSDGSGNTVATYSYDPYGNLIAGEAVLTLAKTAATEEEIGAALDRVSAAIASLSALAAEVCGG